MPLADLELLLELRPQRVIIDAQARLSVLMQLIHVRKQILFGSTLKIGAKSTREKHHRIVQHRAQMAPNVLVAHSPHDFDRPLQFVGAFRAKIRRVRFDSRRRIFFVLGAGAGALILVSRLLFRRRLRFNFPGHQFVNPIDFVGD